MLILVRRCAVLTGVEVVLNRGVGDDDGNTDSQNGGGGNHCGSLSVVG